MNKKRMRRVTSGMALLASIALAAPLAAASKREEAQKLVKTLQTDKKAEKRADAAQRLGTLGAVDAVAALGDALKDPDAEVRGRAAYSLWELRDSAEPARAALLAAVGTETQGRTILNEVAVLRHLKVDRKELQPALQHALTDHDLGVRVDAAKQLVGLADPLLLPSRSKASPTHREFTDSVQLQNKLVESGDRRLPRPIELAQKGDKRQAQYGADYALLFKPQPAKEVLPILQRNLDSPDPEVRRSAASSLERLGEGARPATARLTELLKDPSDDVREAAAKNLDNIGPSAQAAIPALIVAFETTKKREAREACAQALGAMGPLAKSAVPALTKELNNPSGDGFLHNTIQRVLVRIAPKG
jgi:HEAT repeat protein